METNTATEWSNATFNLWKEASDGTRQEVKHWRSTLNKISRRAKQEGRRLRVFCQSMSDTFEGPETCGGPNSENWKLMSRLRQEFLELIPAHPELDFLLLTKRPENVLKYGRAGMSWHQDGVPSNAWIGTSVEDQKTADERILDLMRIPAKVLFLSCEPLLGGVNLMGVARDRLGQSLNCLTGTISDSGMTYVNKVNWVIVGGESGRDARPMHPDSARQLRNQCVEAGVPFFFKQWGEWAPKDHCVDAPSDVKFGALSRGGDWSPGVTAFKREGNVYHDCEVTMMRVGKKAAGRILDGRTWDQFPEVAR